MSYLLTQEVESVTQSQNRHRDFLTIGANRHLLGIIHPNLVRSVSPIVTVGKLSWADGRNILIRKKLRGFPVQCLLCIIWYQTTPTRIACKVPVKSPEGVYTFIFLLIFIKKKIKLPQCRTFSFSVIHPTSFAYVLIIIHWKPISTNSGQFIKWHTTQFFLYKNMS